jgi:hypothetical protein
MKAFLLIGIVILCVVLVFNKYSYEGFADADANADANANAEMCKKCSSKTDCVSCATTDGCSWWINKCYTTAKNIKCPNQRRPSSFNMNKTCDQECDCYNDDKCNNIYDESIIPARCRDNHPGILPGDSELNSPGIRPDDSEFNSPGARHNKNDTDLSDILSFYQDRIDDKKRPPNVYFNRLAEYTPETVVADLNNVDSRLNNFKEGLPGMVAECVENSIQNW